ncbi:hypothetical protein [Paenibacillus sp. FSL K6-1230]|uniref:hypothetical protein n=1 Tax=Paenibacillus sp. FSL K6-1230 TaxID=2921603 RepID=UPI0030FB05F5
MVFILSLMANNTWVSAVSIFIIATIITKLEFLENLAALAWGRDKFWDFRVGHANPKEKDEKLKREEKELKAGSPSLSKPQNYKNIILQFELNVYNALVETSLFLDLKPEVSLTNIKESLIIDLLGRTFDKDIIFELKASSNRDVINNGIRQLHNYVHAYKSSQFNSLLLNRDVKGVLVIKSGMKPLPIVYENMFILEYNEEQKVFSNLDEFKEFIK